MSTRTPWLEKSQMRSALFVAPTVIALELDAGLVLSTTVPWLPAAATMSRLVFTVTCGVTRRFVRSNHMTRRRARRVSWLMASIEYTPGSRAC